jgi:eukaryotic-like serine/threonine-protein kinase
LLHRFVVLGHLLSATKAPVADLRERLQESLAGRYQLDREAGRGGMATVFLAHDVKHDRKVALKVLHPELAATLGPERFQREIRTTARLHHPHILPVLDSGEAAGQLWYTMPFVDGESLRERLRRERQLPVEDALQITRQVADALDYAHSQGVVHRDIKPENILLSRGHALVADFGVARALLAAGGDQLTETGMSVGTPAYMSPEQSLADPVLDGRSDLYSLGCVLYEMLAGEAPYTGTSAQAVLAKRLREPVPHARTVRETVPEGIDAALTRVLAKAPADRFASAREFAGALQATPGVPTPPTQVLPAAEGRRSRWRPATAIAILLGMVIAVAALFAWRRDRPSIEASGSAKMVAVLPFETIGADSSQQYFTAGITEEIATHLSRVSALRVVSSAVTRAYQDKPDRLARLVQDMGVGSAVTGSVRRAGQQVRIAVQLADARTGQTLWSEQYDRSLANILEVQSDIARRVAEALQTTLSPAELYWLAQDTGVDPAAYDLYLRSFEMDYVRQDERDAGMMLLQRALLVDSTFADARAELGRRFYFSSLFGSSFYADSALATVRKVLAMRPDHPGAYAVLGDTPMSAGQLSDARRSYERALALNPSIVPALADLSFTEILLGRPDQGLRWAVRATPLSGNDVVMYYHVGAALLRLEGDDVTEVWLEAGARRESPTYARLETLRSGLDLLRGDDRAAMERARRLVRREPGNEEAEASLAELATTLATSEAESLTAVFATRNPTARSGWLLPESFAALYALNLHRRGERIRADSLWGAALAADQQEMTNGHENPDRWVQTAAIHAIRGDTADALEWLERGYHAGWNDARVLTRDPFFQSLRTHPRFRALLGRMSADITKQRKGMQAITDSLLASSRASLSLR